MDYSDIMQEYGITESEFHLQNILFHGLSIEGENPFIDDLIKSSFSRRYKRTHFLWGTQRYHTRQRLKGDTPYHYKNQTLLYKEKIDVKDFTYKPNEGDGSLFNWHFKHNPWKTNPYWELRLNPINGCSNLKFVTGDKKQFRGCAFCHRMYDYQSKSEHRRTIVSPKVMFGQLFEAHPSSVIAKIEKILFVTGDAKSSDELLNISEEVFFDYLVPNGFKGTFSVVTSQITTEKDIARLSKIDNQIFEYTLECFTRRVEILGPRKGRPLEEVYETLRIAKKYFKFTRINYIVGLDPLNIFKKEFLHLKQKKLIDDTISMNMTAFSPLMEELRVEECTQKGVAFVFEAASYLRDLDLWTRRLGVEKSIFQSTRLTDSIKLDQFLK